MLFWMFVILLAVGGLVLSRKPSRALRVTSAASIIISMAAMGLMLPAIVVNHMDTDREVARLNGQRKGILYMYENGFYDNPIYSEAEMMADIAAFNAHLEEKRDHQRDFWIGVFIPNIYDQVDYIRLD